MNICVNLAFPLLLLSSVFPNVFVTNLTDFQLFVVSLQTDVNK